MLNYDRLKNMTIFQQLIAYMHRTRLGTIITPWAVQAGRRELLQSTNDIQLLDECQAFVATVYFCVRRRHFVLVSTWHHTTGSDRQEATNRRDRSPCRHQILLQTLPVNMTKSLKRKATQTADKWEKLHVQNAFSGAQLKSTYWDMPHDWASE